MADDYNVFGSLCRLNDADIRKKAELALAAKADIFLSDDSEDNEFSITDELEGKITTNRKFTLPLTERAVGQQTSKPSASSKKTANKRQIKAKTTPPAALPLPCNETPKVPEENAMPNSPVARRTRRSITAKQQTPQPTVPTVPKRSKRRSRGRGSYVPTAAPAAETAVPDGSHSQAPNVREMLMNASTARRSGSGSRRRPTSRNVVAELAARCPTVDYVDLVSSPLPPISGTIVVDSESEDVDLLKYTKESKPDLDISFDEENLEMSVKIKWNGGDAEVFKLRKHQKFAHIFEELAKRENANVEHVVLNIDNRIIWPSDTPHSINYKIYEFITGRVLTRQVNPLAKKRDANKISLKIQSELWPKRPFMVELSKTDTFKILYIKCAEELNMALEKLKLSFDGELLEVNATPVDLEFEGGEAIDLRIKE